MKYLVLLAGLFLLPFGALHAQTELSERDVARQLDTPWELLWGPDGYLWLTERGGRISRIHPESGETNIIGTVADVSEISESGLLGMALHPDFSRNPYVYVAHTYLVGGNRLEVKVVRYTYDHGSEALTGPPFTLISGIAGASIHDGCRLLIATDLTMFITTGDAGNQSLPQDYTSLNGKTLRMNLDGSIPADNPNPASLIWSAGHRNAQGLAYGRAGRLYSSEHGPNNDDEFNLLEPARNYGWPNVHGFCDSGLEEQFCADSNVVEPLAAWTPTLAVCGIDFYDHNRIPEWQNSFLMTALKASQLRRLQLSDDGLSVTQQEVVANGYGRLRDVCVAPDGRVFFATSNRDGRGNPAPTDDRIVELAPAGGQPILKVNTGMIHFGRVSRYGKAQRQLLVENIGAGALTIEELNMGGMGPEGFELSSPSEFPVTLAPGESLSLTCIFTPEYVGLHHTFITLSDAHGIVTPVQLVGIAASTQGSRAEIIDFGQVAAGQHRDSTFIYPNESGGAITLVSATLTGSGGFEVLRLSEGPIAPGDTAFVTFRFAPQSDAEARSEVEIEIDVLESPLQLELLGNKITSVKEPNVLEQFTVQPNPARGSAGFVLRSRVSGPHSIAIVDILGNTLRRMDFTAQANTSRYIQWDGKDAGGRNVAPGTYYAVLTNGHDTLGLNLILLP